MNMPDEQDRLTRLLERLIERTVADEVQWETGAPADSYAVDVADVRFRVRSRDGNAQPPYIVDFQRNVISPPIPSDDPTQVGHDILLRLYTAARHSAIAHAPDPFLAVEQQLGINDPT